MNKSLPQEAESDRMIDDNKNGAPYGVQHQFGFPDTNNFLFIFYALSKRVA